MNTPYDAPGITDPETVEAWAVYERANKRAAYLYRLFPNALAAWCDDRGLL